MHATAVNCILYNFIIIHVITDYSVMYKLAVVLALVSCAHVSHSQIVGRHGKTVYVVRNSLEYLAGF